MSGEATPAQIGGLLMAMRVRGESVAEITGAARAMRARMAAVPTPEGAIDVCGTGGDGAGTLNVSTAVTFVLAGSGVPVAKHGNRALSSRTGGADVLAALGVEVEPPRRAPAAYSARKPAASSCSPRATTRPCATPAARGSSSAPAPSSICSGRWPIPAGSSASSPACLPPSGPAPWPRRSAGSAPSMPGWCTARAWMS